MTVNGGIITVTAGTLRSLTSLVITVLGVYVALTIVGRLDYGLNMRSAKFVVAIQVVQCPPLRTAILLQWIQKTSRNAR